MNKEVIIYALSSSEDPFNYRYIGKTANSIRTRLSQHLNEARKGENSNYKNNWLRSELLKGNNILICELEVVNEGTWEEAEKRYISLFRSLNDKMTNSSEGGIAIPDRWKAPKRIVKLTKKQLKEKEVEKQKEIKTDFFYRQTLRMKELFEKNKKLGIYTSEQIAELEAAFNLDV